MRRPRLTEVTAFAQASIGPRRISAWAGLIDGAWMTWRLRRHPARTLLPRAKTDAAGGPQLHVQREIAAAVDAGLAVLPVEATCLRRSITLLRELSRRRQPADLYIGVRSVANRVEAHAWVASGGCVLNDDPEIGKKFAVISAGEFERALESLS